PRLGDVTLHDALPICHVQDRLKLPTTCAAFDVNLGCSGWVFCLGIAQGFLSAAIGRMGLIITADTLTSYIHPLDRSIAFLFGDADRQSTRLNSSHVKI